MLVNFPHLPLKYHLSGPPVVVLVPIFTCWGRETDTPWYLVPSRDAARTVLVHPYSVVVLLGPTPSLMTYIVTSPVPSVSFRPFAKV